MLHHPGAVPPGKLAMVLRRAGRTVTTSMVRHILLWLKARGVLCSPLATISISQADVSAVLGGVQAEGVRRGEARRPSQADTLDVRSVPGVVLKHFTARDILSRWDVRKIHTSTKAANTAGFLGRVVACPSPSAPPRSRAARLPGHP